MDLWSHLVVLFQLILLTLLLKQMLQWKLDCYRNLLNVTNNHKSFSNVFCFHYILSRNNQRYIKGNETDKTVELLSELRIVLDLWNTSLWKHLRIHYNHIILNMCFCAFKRNTFTEVSFKWFIMLVPVCQISWKLR